MVKTFSIDLMGVGVGSGNHIVLITGILSYYVAYFYQKAVDYV